MIEFVATTPEEAVATEESIWLDVMDDDAGREESEMGRAEAEVELEDAKVERVEVEVEREEAEVEREEVEPERAKVGPERAEVKPERAGMMEVERGGGDKTTPPVEFGSEGKLKCW